MHSKLRDLVKILPLICNVEFLATKTKQKPESTGSLVKTENGQRYTFRVLQTIQMKLILLCAELIVLGSTKTALKFKHEI